MPHDAGKWLHDILDAGGFILEQTRSLSLEEYLADRAVQSIAERQFITIGEALNRLHKYAPKIAQEVEDYKQIIQFRNIVVHGYDVIDSTITWGIITGKLPQLLEIAQRLIDESLADSE